MPAWTERNWDHERDLRKHEPRPGERDYVPLRLEPKISPALEVAIAVKNTSNVIEAAKLIEAYVAERFSEQRLEAVAAGARP